MVAQINQRALITQAFYGNFLIYFTSDGEGRDLQNRTTWMHSLPQLSSDGSNTALELAVQATAAAYCGIESSNAALVQDACALYGQALQAHARVLRSQAREAVTVHMVSTSVMLSLFEAMQATTADAYRAHIHGAAKMIEATSAGQCLGGVMCQLFFHVRTQMAFVYLTTQKGLRIPVRKILVETLEYRRLPTFQKLISHIATLAEIYVNFKSGGDGEQLIDLGVYAHVKAEVEALCLEYAQTAESRSETLTLVSATTGQRSYRDAFTALCIAYFASARILFALLAPRVAASYPDLTDYFASILDVAAYLRSHKIGCAYMRMATPLFLVALHSPRGGQRGRAVGVFEEWRGGCMAGISALALERIYSWRKGEDMFGEGGYEEVEVEEEDWFKGGKRVRVPLKRFYFEDWVAQM
ncbi:hypothetical protein BDV95DRAFT_630794 [Massariosphaeria phaeospora]|uniref:Fungal-specific transcription factor domain-containing protein n=1 Tax=Massariosphaeria phaeospora TaxID=100035 RepID=A0A7C8M2M2_9PLEO|nr:hypothetical protein BDV95DRAFT_630794 [Massariosphaeria phaeospora]